MGRLARFSFAFAGAMLAARYLLPAEALLPLGCLCALLALVPGTRICCLGLAAALVWCPTYDRLVRAPTRTLEGQTVTLTATVTDYPRTSSFGGSVTVEVSPFAQALLYYESGSPQPGDRLTCTVSLRPSDLVRGEETDRYTARGIFLLGYVDGPLTLERPDRLPLRFLPLQWGQLLQARIAALYPADEAGLVTAILTGDKSGLSEGDYAALQRSGLAHAVAVSGLHVGFLVQLLGRLFGRYRRRTALLSLPVLLVFVLLTGCTPSVVRAAVMQVLLLLAPLLGREGDSPTALGAALLLLLTQNPYAAAGLSLQLSFLSVAGILLFTTPLEGAVKKALPHPALRVPLTSLATTLGSLALTTPLLAWSFGTVSLLAPVSNLLALWAVALVFVGGLTGVLVGLPLGLWLCRYLLWVARTMAALPFGAVGLSSVYLLGWLVFAYGLAVLSMVRRPRPIVPTCCGILTLCAALVLTGLSGNAGSLTLTVLDVGQGQSVVLTSGGRTALIDCGGSSNRNPGDLAADYLADRGRGQVDLLVLTHTHADHAGGVLELLERMKVSVLALPVQGDTPLDRELVAAARAKGVQVVTVTEDLVLELGESRLSLYAPLGAGEANEAGLSVLCQAGTFAALLTGDMDQYVEKRLVKYGDLPDVDLLVAGHHGAKMATSPLLLDAVQPEVVAVSVGYNTYGHPNGETLLRITQGGGSIYRTDLHGNITITVMEEALCHQKPPPTKPPTKN